MLIDWTPQFDSWLDRLEAQAAAGSRIAQLQLDFVDAQLEVLEELDGEPAEDTAVLKASPAIAPIPLMARLPSLRSRRRDPNDLLVS